MSAKEQAEALRKAMKGWGTDETALIKIIGSKTNAELHEIHKAYAEEIGRDLIADIKSETSRHFEDALVGLITFSAATDAQICKKAMKGLGTDEDLLAEVLCTRLPSEIEACKAAYKEEYKNDLISDVEDECSGHLGKLYSLLLNSPRDKVGDAEEDIEKLYKAGEDKTGTNEGVFIRLLGEGPREYNETLYVEYAKKYGKALDDVIRSEMGGALGRGLAMLVTPLDIHYSGAIYRSMKGAGTDDTSLIRLITTQKGRNLAPACKRFLADYKKTVKAWVQDECSGDYKKLLIEVLENFGKLE